uniref:DNA-directed RNA polymerase III subunit RPC3 n=1 Tax=Acrobeloides nanus TaxID=290746 RepID=A0A914CMY9_9BILA
MFRDMTTVEVDLCVAIIQEYFGHDAALVGKILLTNMLTFHGLIMDLKSKLSVKQIRRIMAIFEHHNILIYTASERGVRYTIPIENVLRILRIPRSMVIVKLMYGKVAEAIFEEIFSQGKISCSDCIRHVVERLQCEINEAKAKFVRLTESQLLIKCPEIENAEYDCPVFAPLVDPFMMPSQILDGSDEIVPMEENLRKRKATIYKPDSDANTLWSINWPRVERFLRDELIVGLISQNELLDETSVNLARAVLKVGEIKADLIASQSNPIAVQEVSKYAREHEIKLSRDEIEQKLSILGKESSGIIHYDLAFDCICRQNIESAIREKLDDRSVRIFRLLCTKGYLEEEQMEKLAMLSSKEVKEICYVLLDHNFITIRPIHRTNDFNPVRCLYLYSVQLQQVAKSLVCLSSKALRNVIIRRQAEAKHNETLTDRQLKMESVISNIKKDTNMDEETKNTQIADVKEMYLTESDIVKLDKLKRAQTALHKAALELEQSLFIFQQYLLFKKSSTLQIADKKKSRKKTEIV